MTITEERPATKTSADFSADVPNGDCTPECVSHWVHSTRCHYETTLENVAVDRAYFYEDETVEHSMAPIQIGSDNPVTFTLKHWHGRGDTHEWFVNIEIPEGSSGDLGAVFQNDSEVRELIQVLSEMCDRAEASQNRS